MALVLDDRVKETSTTTGTGTLNLSGAVSGFQTFVAGIGRTESRRPALERRRCRAGMHRHLHLERGMPGASRERLVPRADLGPGQGRRQDHRLWRQP